MINVVIFINLNGERKHIGTVLVDLEDTQITDVTFDELFEEWRMEVGEKPMGEFISWLVETQEGYTWPKVETIYKVINCTNQNPIN